MIFLWTVLNISLLFSFSYWAYRGYKVWRIAQFARVQTGHGEPLLDSKVMECVGFGALIFYVFFASNSVWAFGPEITLTHWYWTASVTAVFFATIPVIFFHELAYQDLMLGKPSHKWGQVSGVPITLTSFLAIVVIAISNSLYASDAPLYTPTITVEAGQYCPDSSLSFTTDPLDRSQYTVSVIVATVYDDTGRVVRTLEPVWVANQFNPNMERYNLDLTGLPAGRYNYIHNVIAVGNGLRNSAPGVIVNFEIIACGENQ